MLTALVAALVVATPDAGAEPSIDEVVRRVRNEICGKDKGRACDSLNAFLRGKAATAAKAVLTIGEADVISLRGRNVEPPLPGAYVLAIEAGKPATVSMFNIKPENDEETAELRAFIASFAQGRHDPKSPLFTMMSAGVKRQPHFQAAEKDGSLMFQEGRPARGGWIRTVDDKLVIFHFAGTPESPSAIIAQLPK